MPSLSDLHAAFAELEDRAPTEPRVTTAGPARPRGGRFVLAVTVAVAAVVAVIAVAVLIPWVSGRASHRATDPGSGSGGQLLSLTNLQFMLDPLAAYTVIGRTATPRSQSLTLDDNDPSGFTIITLYAPGSWHPSRQHGAVDVKVGAVSGYYGPVTFDGPASDTSVAASGPPPTGSGLVWHDALGVWMSVTRVDQARSKVPGFQRLSQQQASAVASAVHVGMSEDLTLPARFGYLPAGLAVHDIGIGGSSYDPNAVRIQLGPTGTNQVTVQIFIDPTSKNIPAGGTPHQAGSLTTPLTVNGFHGYYVLYDNAATKSGGGTAQLANGTLSLIIASESPHGGTVNGSDPRLSQAEIATILTAMTLAPAPADPSTWFNASDALPR